MEVQGSGRNELAKAASMELPEPEENGPTPPQTTEENRATEGCLSKAIQWRRLSEQEGLPVEEAAAAEENANDLKNKRDTEMDSTDDSGEEERRPRGTVVEEVGKQVVKDT